MGATRNLSSTATLLAALVAWAALLLCGPGAARAGDDERKNFVVGKWAYHKLDKAHKAIAKGQYGVAMKAMESMKRKVRLNDHEKALMWQTIGYIHSSKEQFGKAIKAFEKCLALDALPEGAALDTRYNLGQLYMANRQYAKAASVLKAWIAQVDKPSPDAKYMLALALTQTKQWSQALRWTKEAIAGVRKPQEGWLQLQMSIHFELKQLGEVARVLKRLIARYPKKTYWMQLAAVYAELKQTERSLAVLELADDQGMLTSGSELKNLASLYMHHNVPYKSAQVLQRGMQAGVIKRTERTLTTLGEAWLRAREFERALGPLEQAAKLAAKGNLYMRVAQIHMERERWKKAAAAIQAGLAKGGLTDTGNAHLLLGIARFRADKLMDARKAFQKALGYKNVRQSAENWLKAIAKKVSQTNS